MGLPAWAIIKSRTCRQRRQVQVRPAGPREYKNYAECKDVSLYSAGVESFRAERGSGSDKRSVSDSLYDDVQHLGFRGVRGDRFLTYSNRAGSLETCGFKQRFWSLLRLRPKVTRARGRGTLPVGDMEEKRTGRRGRRPLQRVRRKCAGIWRCVDVGCRGRRPLRERERGRQQI